MDFSTKSLELCKSYSNQTDQLLKISKQTYEKYDNSLSKLHLIIRELNKQLIILKETSTQFNDKYNTFTNDFTSLSNQKQSLFTSIENKLEILKKKHLDKGLVFKNNTNNINNKSNEDNNENNNNNDINNKNNNNNLNTLYDFIDIESLELIKSQFLSELSGLNEICDKSKQIYKSTNESNLEMENRFLEIQKQYNKQIEDSNSLSDLLTQQNNLYKTIQNQLINVASQCDFITFYKPSQSPPQQQQQQQQDFNINNKKEQIQLLLTGSLENIQLMSKNAKEIENQFKESCDIYTLVYLLNEKLSFGNDFSENWETFERFNCIFDQRLAGANYFIGELYSLGKWYDLFDESYDNLLEEVKRRQKEYLRQKTIAEQFNEELKHNYNLEIQNRLKFYDSYGKYLPVSLFSTISDQPISFQVKQITEESVIDYSFNPSNLKRSSPINQQQQPPPNS
ncbi:hypothetical protein ACTFIU_007031 [Dictyostelium citrinum]